MLSAAIISLESESSRWTVAEMEKYFDKVDSININDLEVQLEPQNNGTAVLYKGKPLGHYDCVFCKGSFRYASLMRAISIAYKNKAYLPFDSAAFTIVHDKLLTHLKFQEHDIAMPKTYMPPNSKAARNLLEMIDYPIIMKFPQGTGGKGVMFADSFASASSILDALTSLKQPFIIQEYIDTDGVDIRAIVVGNQVIAAMQRKAVKGESRANIHAGGVGEPCTLDKKTERLAINASKSIGADFCAVDILHGIKGPLVIELNLSPGLQGITKTTGKNIARDIAKHLYQKTKEFQDTEKLNGASEILKDVGIENATDIPLEETTDNTSNHGETTNVISSVMLRGEKILLPDFVTELSKISEKDEVVINVRKGYIEIKKS